MSLLFTYVMSASIVLAIASQDHLFAGNDQYFTQDFHGQYSYGYRAPYSNKQEIRTSDGVTRGSYGYLDATGRWQTVHYVADANGFRVMGTNLPQTNFDAPHPQDISDTIVVQSARSSEQLEKPFSGYVANEAIALPQPVEDTAEVVAAKAEFFKRYEEERQRHKFIRDQRSQSSISTASA